MTSPVLLAIDDRADNLFVIQELMARFLPDCRVVTFQNAADGLAFARQNKVDLVLVDVQMPGMDGIALCRKLKADQAMRHLPVALMTAHHSSAQTRVRGLEAGADDFIVKPIDNIELAARIKVLLRIKKAEDKLRRERDYLEAAVNNRTKALLKLNRMLMVLSDCNDAVIHIFDEARLLKKICRVIVEVGGYPLAWVALRDPGRINRLQPAAVAGQDTGLMDTIAAACRGVDSCRCPTAMAMQTLAPYINNDLLADRIGTAWCTKATESGYASVIALPLCADDQHVFGALNIFSNVPGAFDAEEVSLLKELTANCAHGIGMVRLRKARVKAEEENRLLETHLRQAQKMESIGTLAGGIAHDFNNILSAVIGFTEMAQEDAGPQSLIYGNLQQVLDAGARARELVKQILTFSRQSEQTFKPVQLKRVVKEAMKLMRASLPTTIEIEAALNSDAAVLADPTRIHQVIMNLGANALHAMQAHGGTLTVTLEQLQLTSHQTAAYPNIAPGAFMKLTISDTGPGIPDDILDRIFDPFFTTKEKGEGTGMGLAVVHGIIESHSGSIRVQNRTPQGVRFEILLPVIKQADQPLQATKRAMPIGSERILFVDDEAAVTALVSRMLKSLGYRVAVTNSSEDALQRFREAPDAFDLVITDMTMPKMTGDKLARELMYHRPDLPVILCTGFSAQLSEEEALSLGIKAYIAKPFLKHEIAFTIRDVLDRTAS